MKYLYLKITSLTYSITVSLLNTCLPILSLKIFGNQLFDDKKRSFYLDRKKNKNLIKNNEFEIFRTSKCSVVWFHCSSLGEFEQCRPLIQRIKKVFPQNKIALTFFSPSGYSVAKNYPSVNWVGYLPLDISKQMDLIIKFINPKILILSKNDYWPNMLYELEKQKVPVVSISTRFSHYDFFWSSWACWFKNALNTINHFYVVNKESEKILKKNGISKTTLAGDVRMDRVLNILNQKKDLEILTDFIGIDKYWVAGSTWIQDYPLFLDYVSKNKSHKVIIAPHDCSKKSIKLLTVNLKKSYVLWSKYSHENDNSKKILILDKVGILKYAYKYAEFVYIGGGMGKSGLHNILEAAVYDIPVIIGKNYNRFPEAIDLIKKGGCFSVTDKFDFEEIVEKICKNLNFGRLINYKYIENQKGATNKIFIGLKKYL